MQYDAVLVRFSGEIGIKSKKTIRRYLRILAKNIKARLNDRKVGFSVVVAKWGRIVVISDDCRIAANEVSSIFGVVSTSPVVTTNADMEDIATLSVNYAKELLKPNQTFAIRSCRANKHPFTSEDLSEKVGTAILDAFRGRDVSVNPTSPDVELSIEVRGKDAYLFHEIISGIGGLPLGSEGKFVCLISGGIDSPVACYLTMKRGCVPVFLYFDNYPFAGEDTKQRAIDVARRLSEYAAGLKTRMYIVPHGRDLTEFLKKCKRNLTCILCRRMMYRVAERIAKSEGADAIVSGECIGEQASQTLRNLRVESGALTEFPVVRPLAGMDKVEIMGLARKIGTYEISTRPALCCSVPPKRPATMASLSDVMRTEKNVDIESLIEWDLENAQLIEIRK